MASVVGVRETAEKPIFESAPVSVGAQRAIFWSGIFLTTLLFISTLGKLIRSEGELTALIVAQFASVAAGYFGYFWLRRCWGKRLDELKPETVAEFSLSTTDARVANMGVMKVAFAIFIAGTFLSMFVEVLNDRMSGLPFAQLTMLPVFSIFMWFDQPPKLRIVSTGLMLELPTSTAYFPWGALESFRLINGISVDRVLWTAPGWRGKSDNYETKLVKLSEEEREKFLSVTGEHVGVAAEREVG